MISLETFEDRLDRWGGALDRWPDDARREAEALVATSDVARRLHAAMVEVETALALPPLAGAGERFAAVATRHAQARPSSPIVRRAGWGAAIAAALVLGIVVGQVNLGPGDLGQVGVGGAHDDNPDRVLESALNLGPGNADVD